MWFGVEGRSGGVLVWLVGVCCVDVYVWCVCRVCGRDGSSVCVLASICV